MRVSFCLPHPVAVSAFMIRRGLCACTEMLWMCVLYVEQVVLSGFSKRLFCFVQAKTLCRYGCIYFLAALVLVCVDVIVIRHLRRPWGPQQPQPWASMGSGNVIPIAYIGTMH